MKTWRGKEVRRAEMLQYKEKKQTRMSPGQKVDGDRIISAQYGNVGERK